MLDPRFEAACEVVGRLIEPTDTPPWLTEYFRYWATPLASEWSVERLQPSRREMKKQLTSIVEAANALEEALSKPTTTAFLERAHKIAFSEKFAGLNDSLRLIRNFAYLSAISPALTNETGKTKRGRGRTPVQGGRDPKITCALIVGEAWKFLHLRYPGARNPTFAKAASAFWSLSGGASVGHAGGLSGWRPHFEAAQQAEFKSTRDKCELVLRVLKSQSEGPGN